MVGGDRPPRPNHRPPLQAGVRHYPPPVRQRVSMMSIPRLQRTLFPLQRGLLFSPMHHACTPSTMLNCNRGGFKYATWCPWARTAWLRLAGPFLTWLRACRKKTSTWSPSFRTESSCRECRFFFAVDLRRRFVSSFHCIRFVCCIVLFGFLGVFGLCGLCPVCVFDLFFGLWFLFEAFFICVF